jgi:hypothetical protein
MEPGSAASILGMEPGMILLTVVLILSQVIQALVLRKGQQGCKPNGGNPHGLLTPTQHTYLYQLWQKLVQGKKEVSSGE